MKHDTEETETILQLYPVPQKAVMLKGLYLDAITTVNESLPHVYTNFITSLDGRIAIEQPVTGKRGVPDAISNQRDWRLFQELAACADVLLVSARFLRELVRGTAQANLPISDDPAFADLKSWRRQQGLPSQSAVVILSSSLDLPCKKLCKDLQRRVFVATGDDADPKAVADIEQYGATVLRAGKGRSVDGRKLVKRLVDEGYRNIYSIAGPVVLETLLQARVLTRIYLTQVHRLLGGVSYDTLLEGALLNPPADFKLQALYYDDHNGEACGQFFSIYDLVNCGLPDEDS